MNITIDGYVSYICSNCKKAYTVDGKLLTYEEDTSPEAAEDNYVRYTSKVDAPCVSCGNAVLIKLDVWEYPEAVVNYAYYAVQGARDIECEFTIDHYFNDETANADDKQHSPDAAVTDEDSLFEEESLATEEDIYHETPEVEGYIDQYDDTEYFD